MKNPTPQFRQLVAVVVLPMYLAACSPWQVSEVAPAQFLEQEQPEEIRITQTDGTEFFLQDPQVVADRDELTGTRDGLTGFYIPLADVESIAVHKTSADAAIGALLIAGLLVLVVIAVSNCEDVGTGC